MSTELPADVVMVNVRALLPLASSFWIRKLLLAPVYMPPMSWATPSWLPHVGWNQNSTAPAALSKLEPEVLKEIQSLFEGIRAPKP